MPTFDPEHPGAFSPLRSRSPEQVAQDCTSTDFESGWSSLESEVNHSTGADSTGADSILQGNVWMGGKQLDSSGIPEHVKHKVLTN